MMPVDLYCERAEPGLLAEPMNAVTNVAILVAAWFSWHYAQRSDKATGSVLLLVVLMTAFGVGSGLFHTFANTVTRYLDVVPIALFIVTYLWLYIRQVLGASAKVATASTVVFVAAAIGARQFPDILNGSITYAPALVLVIGLGLVHVVREMRERGTLIAAAAVFFAALVFRTIDNSICAAFPVGTHFLWHLLSALALYLAMRAWIAALSFGEKQHVGRPARP